MFMCLFSPGKPSNLESETFRPLTGVAWAFRAQNVGKVWKSLPEPEAPEPPKAQVTSLGNTLKRSSRHFPETLQTVSEIFSRLSRHSGRDRPKPPLQGDVALPKPRCPGLLFAKVPRVPEPNPETLRKHSLGRCTKMDLVNLAGWEWGSEIGCHYGVHCLGINLSMTQDSCCIRLAGRNY